MTPITPKVHTAAGVDLGGKGRGLAWLVDAGFRVPRTWVIAPGTSPDLSQLDPATAYAVRSSARVEDGAVASYAGQFDTRLGVEGLDAVGEAVASVRRSASGERAAAYNEKMGRRGNIDMTVLVQEMVMPVASGVVFTRNPITGLNEIVLEALPGRGDTLVAGGVTPQRWVWRWGAWTMEPDDPCLPEAAVDAIVAEARDIAEAYGRAADLEFAWDGTTVWWLQIRPITGIDSVAVFSNRISKEVMPGLIKPLVWSVNVPVVNRAWIGLFTEAIGPNDIEPDDLARSFAYRSYFNMGAIGDIFELMGMPRDSLELLLGLPEGPQKPSFKPTAATMRKMPRLVWFAMRRGRYGSNRAIVPELRSEYERYDRDLSGLDDADVLRAVDELMALGTRAAYANIVVPLLANLYTTLLRKRLERRDIDLASVDIADESSRSSENDPNPALDALAGVIAESGPASADARRALAAFLDRFGHFSDSGNDFSVPPWREQPELVVRMAESRISGGKTVDRVKWRDVSASLGPLGRLALGSVRSRAARYQTLRDGVSSVYTYGYGLFRRYFLEIGARLETRGVLSAADDIMFLTFDQVRDAVEGRLEVDEARRHVDGHRQAIADLADLQMPEVIYGEDFIAIPESTAGTLHGVATARGHHRGPIRVVSGLADFDKVEVGDVLAIPFSDVGWTPLFAKAGAVVAESGGMLSHSSIVAREYGIPCVVSVAGATRLPEGASAIVDGYRGTVTVD